MELWDIYDKNRNLTGRKIKRGSYMDIETKYVPCIMV